MSQHSTIPAPSSTPPSSWEASKALSRSVHQGELEIDQAMESLRQIALVEGIAIGKRAGRVEVHTATEDRG
jgi:hypothetical protein